MSINRHYLHYLQNELIDKCGKIVDHMKQKHASIGGHIFAAGLGTRLLPYTETTPKPLFKVHDVPMVFYPLSLLESIPNIGAISINTQHLAEQFNSYTFPINVKIYKELEIEGHGTTMRHWSNLHAEDILIALNGDTIYDVSSDMLDTVIQKFLQRSIPESIGVITKKAAKSPLNIVDSKLVGIDKKDGGVFYYTDEPSNNTPAVKSDAVGIYLIPKEIYSSPLLFDENGAFMGMFGVDDLAQRIVLRMHGEVVCYELPEINAYGLTNIEDLTKLNNSQIQLPYGILKY